MHIEAWVGVGGALGQRRPARSFWEFVLLGASLSGGGPWLGQSLGGGLGGVVVKVGAFVPYCEQSLGPDSAFWCSPGQEWAGKVGCGKSLRGSGAPRLGDGWGNLFFCSLCCAKVHDCLHQTWKVEKHGVGGGETGVLAWVRGEGSWRQQGLSSTAWHILPRLGVLCRFCPLTGPRRGKRVCVEASLATPATLPSLPFLGRSAGPGHHQPGPQVGGP